MKKNSLGINALLNGLRSALNLLFPLITFPYVSRVLSVNGMGIYNFSSTYVSYFTLVAGLGVSTYAVREGAKYRDDIKKINIFSSQVFTISIVSTLIAYFLLIGSLLIFSNLRNYVSCILILGLQIFFTTIGTEWIYIIYEDYQYITVRSITFKIISVLLLFIFVRTPNDYLWYAAITVFAGVGSNVLNFIHARSFSDIRLVKETNWRYHLKPILIIFATSVAITLYVSSDTTILGLLKNDYAVGIYGVSVKIYTIVNSLISGLLMVTIPRLAMLIGKRKIKEYVHVLQEVISSLSVLGLPAAVGVVMLSKEIILIIAGKKYLDGVLSLQIITWALIFSNFSTIFNQCVLIPAKREAKSLRNTVITGLVNIGLNFIFIPIWSYNGTAFSTVIAEFMVMFLNCWSARDYVGPILSSKKTLKNIYDSIIGCLGIVGICLLLKIGISSLILRTLLSVILSIWMYGAVLVVLKDDVAMEYLSKVVERIKGK